MLHFLLLMVRGFALAKSFMPTKVKQQQALIQNYPVKHPTTI
jgi:hypothetical protein